MTSFGGHSQRIFSRILEEGFENGDYLFPSGYLRQTWGALHKCWLGFVIAKEKLEWDKIEIYAKRIKN